MDITIDRLVQDARVANMGGCSPFSPRNNVCTTIIDHLQMKRYRNQRFRRGGARYSKLPR
jgi:hypothetical protein